MKRRDFFKRIVGGAAALLGIKALEKPKKEWVYGEFWVNEDRFVIPDNIPVIQTSEHAEHVFYDHGPRRFVPCTNNPPHPKHTLLCGKWADV